MVLSAKVEVCQILIVHPLTYTSAGYWQCQQLGLMEGCSGRDLETGM